MRPLSTSLNYNIAVKSICNNMRKSNYYVIKSGVDFSKIELLKPLYDIKITKKAVNPIIMSNTRICGINARH
ncbi:hypothetical protein MBUL_01465 [Methylobacterium bullatum]|uniref:Uncharacterized protein n=1 Tax=Methylobacterium bullatum TaxID=570505 RepID=A0A679IT04_9HYPH|nr:hypothetical protein MBUL_01465 [Methylobacterium bullatum]